MPKFAGIPAGALCREGDPNGSAARLVDFPRANPALMQSQRERLADELTKTNQLYWETG